MKRLTHDEAKQYRPLSSSELRYSMRRVIAYTLTPVLDDPGWEEITYYGAAWVDPTNTPQNIGAANLKVLMQVGLHHNQNKNC